MFDCHSNDIVHTFDHDQEVIDIVVPSDNLHIYCSTEGGVYKWNLESKEMIEKYRHPRGENFLYMVLSTTDQFVMCNGYGSTVRRINFFEEDQNK